jgi:hypothetical protein
VRAALAAVALAACTRSDEPVPGERLCHAQPDACSAGSEIDAKPEPPLESDGDVLRVTVEIVGWTDVGSRIDLWGELPEQPGVLHHERHELCTVAVQEPSGRGKDRTRWGETLSTDLVRGVPGPFEACDVNPGCPEFQRDGTERDRGDDAATFRRTRFARDDVRIEDLTVAVTVTESNGDLGRGAACATWGPRAGDVPRLLALQGCDPLELCFGWGTP